MYDIRLIEHSSPEYKEMLLLRAVTLWEPLEITLSEHDLQKEINDLFVGCFREEDELMVGCCVLTPIEDLDVQLRQIAVLQEFQGKGIGHQIIDFAEKEALLSGFSRIIIHAQESAIPFYEKNGFKMEGDAFIEVGIPHFEMQKIIQER